MNSLINRTQGVFQKHRVLVLAIAGAILCIETYFLLIRPGVIIPVDWTEAFRPAALALLEGLSPYETHKVFNPPWVLLPMIPLALLPVDLSSTAMFLLAFIGVAVAAYRLGAKTGNILIFLANPYTYFGASMGNIDWLIPLGAVLPPQIGLFLVLSKPQIGLGVAIFLAHRGISIRQNKTSDPDFLASHAGNRYLCCNLWLISPARVTTRRFVVESQPVAIRHPHRDSASNLRSAEQEYIICGCQWCIFIPISNPPITGYTDIWHNKEPGGINRRGHRFMDHIFFADEVSFS